MEPRFVWGSLLFLAVTLLFLDWRINTHFTNPSSPSKPNTTNAKLATQQRQAVVVVNATSPHQQSVIILMRSEPSHTNLRDLHRTEIAMGSSSQNMAKVKLIFLIDPEVAQREKAPMRGLSPFERLAREQSRFKDIVFVSLWENITSSSFDSTLPGLAGKLNAGEGDLIITTNDRVLVFPEEMLTANQWHRSSSHQPEAAFEKPCAFKVKDARGDLELLECGFREEGSSKTVYEWIAGRCSPLDFVYYVHNTGPSDMLTQLAKRIYFEYRQTGLVCRDDWKEIAVHNGIRSKLLVAWEQFAKKHIITSYLVAGTLLGVPRHNGWVAYDHDVDVLVLPDCLTTLFDALLNDKMNDDFWQPYWWDDVNGGWKTEKTERSMMPPEDRDKIRSYFSPGCEKFCWVGGLPMMKIRYKESCLYDHDNPYTLDLFTQPPSDVPPLKHCVLEGIPTMCPEDTDAWLFREYGEDWRTPDKESLADLLHKSDPYHPCPISN